MTRAGGFAAAVFAALLVTGAAQAGPREDVLTGAIRCGGAGDDRQWLNCYYGAAQPVRAQLRLIPASQAQQALAANPPSGGPMNGMRQDVLSAAIRCGGAADDRQWLDCYYGAAQPMRAQLGLSPAPQRPAQQTAALPQGARPMAAPPQQAASTTPPGYVLQKAPSPKDQSFPGMVSGLLDQEDPVTFESRLASYTLNSDGFFTATLANGQVWREIDGLANPRWTNEPATYKVTIRRGMMRSYNFRVEGDPNVYKVARVR